MMLPALHGCVDPLIELSSALIADIWPTPLLVAVNKPGEAMSIRNRKRASPIERDDASGLARMRGSVDRIVVGIDRRYLAHSATGRRKQTRRGNVNPKQKTGQHLAGRRANDLDLL